MISIVIPVYGQLEIFRECITAIRKTAPEGVEIVVIDNGSTPPVGKIYTGFIPCQVIRNEKNEGFPKAVNQGIAAASGDIIVLLNSDVIVSPGWIERIAAPLDEFSIIGPVTNYSSGIQRILPGLYENEAEYYKIVEEVWENFGAEVQEVNWIIGFMMVFRKSLWEELGPFDESLWPCSGEEIDFCMRARTAGHRVGIALGCYVHHEGSQTFKAMQNSGEVNYKEVIAESGKHLREKWGNDIWARQVVEDGLIFTGERAMPLSPAMPQDVMREHLERYECAALMVSGKMVLDVACGAGYGSDMLAEKAGFVIGGDVSQETIDYCRDHYKRPNLKFAVFDVREIPHPDNFFDVVVSFETIEHIPDGGNLLSEAARVLSPDGRLIISTPLGGPCGNPYHVSYYQRGTFGALLENYFENVTVFYQRNGLIHGDSVSPDHHDTFTGEFAFAVCERPRKGVRS